MNEIMEKIKQKIRVVNDPVLNKYLNKFCKDVSVKKTFFGTYSKFEYSFKLFVTTITFGIIKKGIVVF